MFQPGSISKIELKNFVTYTYGQFYPGTRLNLIVGPNGSGKSTIVAAIILGLGGNPKIVGRGKKINEFVKRGKVDSRIQITLANPPDPPVVIARLFDMSNKSWWFIDSVQVTLEDVFEKTEQFNIQVDNLCQFLPQDRVHDFSKLNKQELLVETQLAICRTDLIDKQDELVATRLRLVSLGKSIEEDENDLAEAIKKNQAMEGKIQNLNNLKEYNMSLEHVERKLMWSKYDEICANLTEIKTDREAASKIFRKYETDVKLFERELKLAKDQLVVNTEVVKKTQRAISTLEENMDTKVRKNQKLNVSVNRINAEMKARMKALQERQANGEVMIKKLEGFKRDRLDILYKVKSFELENWSKKVEANKKTIDDVEWKKGKLLNDKQNVLIDNRVATEEVARLEDVNQARLRKLKMIDEDAYKAVVWLRENKDEFEDEIVEPMMLHLNVLEVKNAIYFDSLIRTRDALLFICLNLEDMNRFLRLMRTDKGLRVNVAYFNPAEHDTSLQPTHPIENIKQFGFHAYLSTLVTGPPPIIGYLAKMYYIHEIPIGNDETDEHYEEVPKEIVKFFSNKYRYKIVYSKFSGHRCSKQVAFHGKRGAFSSYLNVPRLTVLRDRMETYRQNCERIDEQVRAYELELKQLNETNDAIITKLNEFDIAKQKEAHVNSRIQAVKDEIADMKDIDKKEEQIRDEAQRNLNRIEEALSIIVPYMANALHKLFELKVELRFKKIANKHWRNSKSLRENQLVDARRWCTESEDSFNKIKDLYVRNKSKAKQLLSKAKGLSNNCVPTDPGFSEYRALYDELPDTVIELAMLKDKILAKIGCLTMADDDEIQLYDERVKFIETKQIKLEQSNAKVEVLTKKEKTWKRDWLNALYLNTETINASFSKSMEYMGYAGEISLYTPSDDSDYAQYGLNVMVKFRDSMALQELTRNLQSGGERAVTTAVYMLSLQDLTPVPFRCVDEINQGMDADNERRIFDLFVEKVEKDMSAQYFIVTPKLVNNLRVSDALTTLVVFNGDHVNRRANWTTVSNALDEDCEVNYS